MAEIPDPAHAQARDSAEQAVNLLEQAIDLFAVSTHDVRETERNIAVALTTALQDAQVATDQLSDYLNQPRPIKRGKALVKVELHKLVMVLVSAHKATEGVVYLDLDELQPDE